MNTDPGVTLTNSPLCRGARARAPKRGCERGPCRPARATAGGSSRRSSPGTALKSSSAWPRSGPRSSSAPGRSSTIPWPTATPSGSPTSMATATTRSSPATAGKDHQRLRCTTSTARHGTGPSSTRDIAAQDLRGGDLDGDGTPDVVAVGGSTHNVVWYRFVPFATRKPAGANGPGLPGGR